LLRGLRWFNRLVVVITPDSFSLLHLGEAGPKKIFFCVPMDELLWAKDDLLSEGGQSLNSIFADCFGDWLIGIPFVGDDVVAKCISNLH